MISYRWCPQKKLKERIGFQRRILGLSVSQIRKGVSVGAGRGPEERDVKLDAFLGIPLRGFLIKQPHIK